MKIGLLSDTRIPGIAKEVPPQVARAFEGVDLILHAGGIQADYVLDWLEQIAPVKAVGRVQGRQYETSIPYHLESEDQRVAQMHILQLEGYTLGMVNALDLNDINDDVFPGFLAARNLPPGDIARQIRSVFDQPVDIVVFGRTLEALVEEHDGILFVNPGSPTMPKNSMRLGQVALMELEPGSRNARIVELSEFN